MNKKESAKQKTILNVGYCETTSEWLNRILLNWQMKIKIL